MAVRPKGGYMTWSLFFVALAIWVLFGDHYDWLTRFKQMTEAEFFSPPAGFVAASKILCAVAVWNLIVFFVVYGIKISWLWSSIIVIGGYFASIIVSKLIGNIYSTLRHKIGWIAIPALSISLWFLAFKS